MSNGSITKGTLTGLLFGLALTVCVGVAAAADGDGTGGGTGNGTGGGSRDGTGGGKKVGRQIVVGQTKKAVEVETEADELPVKRQVVVEPKPKKKIVEASAVIADAAPAAEPEVETPAVETPTDDQATTEAPAEEQAAPEQKFEVGQIIKAGDGISYVIVKVNETGVSVMPLSAFADYEPVKKVYKKKRYKKRYSSYRNYGSYGGSSCH